MLNTLAVPALCAIATLLAVFPPFGVPGYCFALGGAALLMLGGHLPPAAALMGAARSVDVCCFLAGMMLLAELCRQEAVFAWIAGHAARAARGSAMRLFTLVFLIGIVVTALLSNDATVVVLTPAVAAMARASGMEKPAPLLFACAFVANAASFLLPIANPANLVLYGQHMPGLAAWLPRYALPSLAALTATYVVLRLSQRGALAMTLSPHADRPRLTRAGQVAALGTLGAVAVMLGLSLRADAFGPATLAAALLTAALVWLRSTVPPTVTARHISWDILPLVVGLFMLVAALDRSGLTRYLQADLTRLAATSRVGAIGAIGILVALACNLANNLPVGLLTGQVFSGISVSHHLREAALIGVDLGPNLSVTGSLATILWLDALKRDGFAISAARFFRLGLLVTPPALLLALAALSLG